MSAHANTVGCEPTSSYIDVYVHHALQELHLKSKASHDRRDAMEYK